MLTYTGTKTIKAFPMTRAEYNAYRGWELPANENGADEGYLVEYEPDGNTNHEDHEGYISWSPAAVFESTYKPANTWVERLDVEGDGLSDRLGKLREFMETDAFATLPWLEKDALNRQMQHMAAYLGVLRERRDRVPPDPMAAGGVEHPHEIGDPENPEIDAPAAEVLDGEASK